MDELKRKENINKKAGMLNIRKDEIDKLSTSLPGKDMPTFLSMLAYLMQQEKSLGISVTQDISKEDIVRVERNERNIKVSERLKRIYSSCEERSLHFAHKQEEYDVEVSEKLLELEEWYVCIQAYDGRTPNEQDYSEKFNEIQKELQELNSRINPTLFFKDGPDDVALCGYILIINETKWNASDEQKAVCLMSALQWLVRLRNELPTITTIPNHEETISTPPPTAIKEEDAEVAELLQLLADLKINIESDQSSIALDGKHYCQGQILTAIMQKYQDEEKEWAMNPNRFSQKIVQSEAESAELTSELKKKADAISKRIRRAKRNIGEARLKDLSAESIQKSTKSSLRGAQLEYDKWDGLYSSVRKILDTVRRGRADKNGQERTEMDKSGQERTKHKVSCFV